MRVHREGSELVMEIYVDGEEEKYEDDAESDAVKPLLVLTQVVPFLLQRLHIRANQDGGLRQRHCGLLQWCLNLNVRQVREVFGPVGSQ